VSLPRWIPEQRTKGKDKEVFSLLGPFFRMTTLPAEWEPEKFFTEKILLPNQEKIMVKHFRVQARVAQKSKS